jgi:hypothetical protein
VFAAALALLWRRTAPRLLGICLGAAVLTVLVLYHHFLGTFVWEILPAWTSGAPGNAASIAGDASLTAAFARIPMFYGYGYPLLALVALAWSRRRLPPERFAVLAAYGATFVVLLVVRGLSSTFKDLKETTFIAPFMAVTAGYVLDELATHGRRGRALAWTIATALAAFGLLRYARYLQDGLLTLP